MARKLEDIIAAMDAEQANQADLNDLNSPSQTAIYTLWKYIQAIQQYFLEVLIDKKKAEIEALLALAVPPSASWVRQKSFEFQYDASTPQIMQLVNNVPTYVPVDTSKRIITRCSVVLSAGISTVLVAKDEPPVKLTSTELAAFQDYFINTGDGTNQAVGIGFAGQNISAASLDPDLVYLKATIYYAGQYAATFPAACITALQFYFSHLPQNSTIRVVDLTNAIESVPGFVDIFINDLSVRPASVIWAGPGTGTSLVASDTLLDKDVVTDAGYAIGETTATFTLTDKLTFTAV